MSEYDELVKGARAWKVGPFDDYAEKVALVGDLCDAIEALVGEVKELTADVDALIADVSSLGDNLDKVAAERDYFRDAFRDCANREAVILQREADRAKASQAEVERLKGVLGEVKRRSQIDPGPLPHESQVLVKLQSCFEIARSALEAKP